jgi:hypothetical protein
MNISKYIPALILTGVVLTNFNPNFMLPKLPVNYLVILVLLCFSTFLLIVKKKVPVIFFLILSVIISIVPSVINSAFTDVSTFKLVVFSLGTFSYLIALDYSCKTNKNTLDIMFNLFRGILLSSAVTYLIGFGYPRNETGFAGILNHPQAFGILLVFIFTFQIHKLLSQKSNIGDYLFIFLTVVMVYGTESRTAFLCVCIIFIFTFFLHTKNTWKQKTKKQKKVFFFILLFGFSCTPLLVGTINQVMSKHGRSEASSAVGALQNSRLRFVISSIDNFMSNPLTGIGFQVSNGHGAHYPMEIERGPFGIPIKAPIEKGSFFPSLFEEVGLIGALPFIILLHWIFSYRRDAILTKSIILAVLLLSFGEATLFSYGSIGALNWLFVFYALSLVKYRRIK